MVKLLFTLAGIGYGHQARVQAIINELQKRAKPKIHIMTYGPAFKHLSKKFATTSLRAYYYPEKQAFSILSTLKANWQIPKIFTENSKRTYAQIKQFEPDAIITDGELSTNRLFKKVKIPIISIHNFKPAFFKQYMNENKLSMSLKAQYLFIKKIYSWIEKRSHQVIIPSLLSEKRTTFGKISFVSPIVRTQSAELPNIHELLCDLCIRPKSVLLQTGGTKLGQVLLKYIVRIAPNFKQEFLIFDTPLKGKNIRSLAFSPDILQYLKVSDWAISLAGHSFLSEALVYRIPAFIVPIKSHLEQLVNAWTVEQAGLAYTYTGDLTEKKLSSELNKFLEQKKVIRNNLRKRKYGNGAAQAAEIILNQIK